jgi:hypothetical protein
MGAAIDLKARRACRINSKPSLEVAVYFWYVGVTRNRTQFIAKLTVKEL